MSPTFPKKFINSLTYFITDDSFVKKLRQETGLRIRKSDAFDVLDNYQTSVGHDGVLPWQDIADAWRNR